MFKLTSCDYWPAVKSILALKVTKTNKVYFYFEMNVFRLLLLLAVPGVGGVQLDVSAPAASAVTSGSGQVRAAAALVV